MPNRVLCDSSGGSYSYDNNGNWTKLAGSASTYTFTYDAENRLDYYTAPGMSSAYSSNGMGLRVAESDSGSGEHDLINDGSGAGSPLLVDHNISARTVAHVYTPGLEQRDGLNGALHLMGVDALGSVRAFINDDSGQAVTDTQGYYAYGLTRSRTGSDWMAFGFAGAEGYQTDPNQLMLLGNREYHPFTGRFLTRDPAGAGDNDYEYAEDNPLSYVDPTGLYASGGENEYGSQNSPGAAQSPGGEILQEANQIIVTVTDWQNWAYKDGSYAGSTIIDQYTETFDYSIQGFMDAPRGPPTSYEPGEENGVKGTWKNYKDGSREFEPHPAPPVKKTGHGDGGRNQGTSEGEHSRNQKGNRTPPSTGGSRQFVDDTVTAADLAGAGYLLWEGFKWTGAALAAPETAGGSLILAAVTP